MSVKYKMLVKRVEGREYLIKDFMATKLSRKKFEALQACNECLKEWQMVEPCEVDFTWWDRCFKKLTPSAIRRAEFECDYYGNVEEI